MVILKNFISEPSDENGIARFTKLTSIATMESLAYIHFYAEGVTTLWTDRIINANYDDIMPPRAFSPIIVKGPDITINIINDESREITEGSKIDPPIKIHITEDETLKPMPNIFCFATIYKSYENILPLGYQSTLNKLPVKYLERPIPGVYSTKADDPENSDPVIKEYWSTNEDGVLTFNDLRISQSGPIGSFYISVDCNGNHAYADHSVIVKSSIKHIKFEWTVIST
jgi:hypothetical protein